MNDKLLGANVRQYVDVGKHVGCDNEIVAQYDRVSKMTSCMLRYLWLDRKPLVEYTSRIILLLELLQLRQTRSVNGFRCLVAVCKVDVPVKY